MPAPLDIAGHIIHSFLAKKRPVSHLKLQKLMYYTKAWSLVNGTDISESLEFVRWRYGPVNRDVYRCFPGDGSFPIAEVPFKFTHVDSTTAQLIDFVTGYYGDYGAMQLSALTHKEDPWKETPNEEVISNDRMKAFYETQPFAKNFPLGKGGEFHLAMTDTEHAFVLDMSDEDQLMTAIFSSREEYDAKAEAARKAMPDWLQRIHG